MNNKPVFGDYDTITHLKRAEAEANFRNAVSDLFENFHLDPYLAGTIIGRIVLKKIDQKLFETLALVLALAAGINLLYKSWGG